MALKKTISLGPRALAFALALALFFSACGGASASSGEGGSSAAGSSGGGGENTVQQRGRSAFESGEMQFLPENDNQAVAVFDTSRGEIRAVLYPDEAPLAVYNFYTLAEAGHYNGSSFDRVMQDFAIEGGSPASGGAKSAWGHPFRSEYAENLHHYSGALCMAPGKDAESGEAGHMDRFYIVATPQDSVDEATAQKLRDAGESEGVASAYLNAGGTPYLDYTDTVFGQVVTGMDVVDKIASSGADETGAPKTEIIINSVVVYGYTP